MRLFLAFPLHNQILDELGQVIRRLQSSPWAPELRCGKRTNLHLTVKFLGEQPKEALAGLRAEIHGACSGYSPVSGSVDALGAFPSLDQARVLWAGVGEHSGTLTALVGELDRRLSLLGIPPETRPFAPHITLARVKKRLPPPFASFYRSLSVSPHTLPLGQLELVASALHPNGPVYERVASFPLGS